MTNIILDLKDFIFNFYDYVKYDIKSKLFVPLHFKGIISTRMYKIGENREMETEKGETNIYFLSAGWVSRYIHMYSMRSCTLFMSCRLRILNGDI